MIFEIGEKVHLIERRYFENDPYRHFIGEIMLVEGNVIRVKGHPWIFNLLEGKFIKIPNLRESVMALGERTLVTIIPKKVNLNDIKCIDDKVMGLIMTDGKRFVLTLDEFSSGR